MIALIQRVRHADVVVAGEQVGAIGPGLLALIGMEKGDSQESIPVLLKKLLKYRVFTDEHDKMNLSLKDTAGGLLLVPQFTLAADTRKGLRPGFSSAAPPERGKELFDSLCRQALAMYPQVAFGRFGADMKVSLLNDGPVTFWLQVN